MLLTRNKPERDRWVSEIQMIIDYASGKKESFVQETTEEEQHYSSSPPSQEDFTLTAAISVDDYLLVASEVKQHQEEEKEEKEEKGKKKRGRRTRRKKRHSQATVEAARDQEGIIHLSQGESFHSPETSFQHGDPRLPSLNILLAIIGTRGDIQPFVALARALIKEVCFLLFFRVCFTFFAWF